MTDIQKRAANNERFRQIEQIVTDFRGGILDGRQPDRMCFVTCFALSGYLQFLGFDNELVEGELRMNGELFEHYWIRVDDVIVDPTASQFPKPDGKPMPNVYIGKKPRWYRPRPTEN